MPTLGSRKRLIGIAIFVFGLFSLLIAQFYKIQILEGEKWTRVAKRQHFFVVNEPFLRGTFYSNTSIKRGHPESPQRLVLDIQKFHLYIDPVAIPVDHRETIAGHLTNALDLSGDHVRKQFNVKSRSRKIAMWIDRESKELISDWWQGFSRKNKIARNALFFIPDHQRTYPFGKLLGQVLHTVRQSVPTGGLELYFDSYLQGKEGKRLLKRSPRHSFETGTVITSPKNGADIYLTINHILQAIVEEELAKGVKSSNAKGGWAVMMEPRTGEILTLAQYPFFYPPEYSKYFNDPDLVEHTKVKAITDAHEPGSVMKPITLAIALTANELMRQYDEEEIFDPEEKIPTADGHFPGRTKELKDMRLHHYLNMYMGLQKSSNIYMARLAERVCNRLGDHWYRYMLHDIFGFGQKTNIELPAESAGVLPTPGKVHPNGKLEWSKPTPYSLAMGHNIQVNSIQLLRSYALFANGGYLVQPTLVRKIEGEEKKVFEFPRVLSREVVDEVVKAMKYVTKTGGSGRRADIWGYTEVGKSATANKIVGGQYSQTQYVAGFIGFAPVTDPAFVLLVMIDEPEYRYIPGYGRNHHGGAAAAPVFRSIATRALEYLGVAPDDPYGYPVGDPRYDPEKADWIPETRKLKEIYEKWNNG